MTGDHVVGIDIGGTKCLAVLTDGEDRPLVTERRPTPQGADALVAVVVELVESLPPAAAVGVGAAGLVTSDGVLRTGPNLPGIVELPLAAVLTDRIARPVVVDNDNTCATVAEWRLGAGRDVDDLLFVGLGTGIGGGFVSGGHLQRGSHGFAGEIGHMTVEADGLRCVCGRSGCWERYASGSGLARLAREAATANLLPDLVHRLGDDPEAVRGEHITDGARRGDPDALAVLDDHARWVALGIVDLVNVLDPDVVVVGGGLAEAADVLLDPVRRWVVELLYSADHRPHPRIEPAALGERAAAIGAALLARDLVSA